MNEQHTQNQVVGTIPASLPLLGHGVIICGVTRTPLVQSRGRVLIVKALSANTGRVYLGSADVTSAVGSTNTTTGYELRPGESAPYTPLNAETVWNIIGTAAGDGVTYLLF